MNRCRAAVVLIAFAATSALAAPDAKPVKRSPKAIETDLAEVNEQLSKKYRPADVMNPKYRKSVKDAVVPLISRRVELLTELSATSPAAKKLNRWALASNLARLTYFGDEEAKKTLDTQAESAVPAEAIAGKLGQQAVLWWNAAGKADEQSKILDTVGEMATQEPRNDDIAVCLSAFIHANCATTELASRTWDILAKMKSQSAMQLNAVPNKIGKPISFSGPTLNGKTFKSADWKGKVVLVDFWATWCPPCMEEIPRVAKLYADYHDKGLEIVGVNSDVDRKALLAFLKQHPEMPWPQMFVGGSNMHPLGKKFGITGIPTMYLIDRNGILRTITARSDAEELIPKLLAETKDGEPSADVLPGGLDGKIAKPAGR